MTLNVNSAWESTEKNREWVTDPMLPLQLVSKHPPPPHLLQHQNVLMLRLCIHKTFIQTSDETPKNIAEWWNVCFFSKSIYKIIYNYRFCLIPRMYMFCVPSIGTSPCGYNQEQVKTRDGYIFPRSSSCTSQRVCDCFTINGMTWGMGGVL